MALRIVFCGTPAFAVPPLQHLIAQPDFQLEAVVTQPDRPRGRGREMATSPVKDAALAAGVPVFQPEKIKSEEALDYFKRLAPDAVVIIAYGQIISQRLIDIPRLGWVNLHASLLPKYRGAAPINWAIVNGETRTGVTSMQIDSGLDTGPMLLKYETEIGRDETAPELGARLADAGAPLIAETLRGVENGKIAATPQDGSQATLAPPLKKEDGRVDWSLDARAIYNRIRGLQPWPGAFTTFRGKNCQIWGKPLKPVAAGGMPGIMLPTKEDGLLVICGGASVLRVDHVQLEGRKRITAEEFLNGARLVPGERFGG
ncbi:MAG TPA: methionyl-tRNA formyltransferase [Candidatus Baltobacteraceae bacterium]|nr:methionyl-tRNA formyltransferase [Candidatus Baltobacteraceae bacterium]